MRARADFFGKRFNRLRADVESHHVGGNRFAVTDNFCRGAGFDAFGDHMIGGQQELQFVSLRLLQEVLGEFDFVFFDQTLANGLPLRLKKGVGHAAADDEDVDFAEQVLDDSDFVADLGATENRDERMLRVLQDATQDIASSFSMSRPAADFCTNLVMPTVDAWARWAVPKASLT